MLNFVNLTNGKGFIYSLDDGRMLCYFWVLRKRDNVPQIGVTLSKSTGNTPLLSYTLEYVTYTIIRYIRNTYLYLTH